jgi:hypothetical protein
MFNSFSQLTPLSFPFIYKTEHLSALTTAAESSQFPLQFVIITCVCANGICYVTEFQEWQQEVHFIFIPL